MLDMIRRWIGELKNIIQHEKGVEEFSKNKIKKFEYIDDFEIKKRDINSVDAKILTFYEEQFSLEAKKNSSDKGWILYYCITKAWRDATISERFKKGSEIIKNKDKIISFFEDQLLNNQSRICMDFNQWHNSICELTLHNMRYGVWQKLINMTFKYLYCIKDVFPEFSSVWDVCHCPIDTIISKSIYRRLKEMNISSSELIISEKISKSDSVINWNNITKNDYIKLQNQIKLICADNGIFPIEFDFLYWEK